jgi:hypothetical protein
MTEKRFWQIISALGQDPAMDEDEQCNRLEEQLRDLPPADLFAFQRLYDEKIVAAYRWDMWGAAYLINEGCSDDGFVYFRAWLVTQGEAVYQAALEEPDSLAAVVDPAQDAYEAEAVWEVARRLYQEATGAEMPATNVPWPLEPAGERCNFDDEAEVMRRLPRLTRRNLEL